MVVKQRILAALDSIGRRTTNFQKLCILLSNFLTFLRSQNSIYVQPDGIRQDKT